MSNLTSAVWWKAAGIRAIRTAILVATTYLPASLTDAVPYTVLASAAVVAGILSLITSLAGIAEVDGTTQPWYFALLSRVVKTVSQALVSGVLANVVFLADINWQAVVATTITAGLGSLLLGILKTLPESDEPVAMATIEVQATNPQGEQTTQVVNTFYNIDASPEEPKTTASKKKPTATV